MVHIWWRRKKLDFKCWMHVLFCSANEQRNTLYYVLFLKLSEKPKFSIDEDNSKIKLLRRFIPPALSLF